MEPTYTFEDFKKSCNELNMYMGVNTLLNSLGIKIENKAFNINAYSLAERAIVIYGNEDGGLLISSDSGDVINFAVKLKDGDCIVRAFSLEVINGGVRLVPNFKAKVDPLALVDIPCIFHVTNDLTRVVDDMKSKPGHEVLDSPRVKYC